MYFMFQGTNGNDVEKLMLWCSKKQTADGEKAVIWEKHQAIQIWRVAQNQRINARRLLSHLSNTKVDHNCDFVPQVANKRRGRIAQVVEPWSEMHPAKGLHAPFA